MSYVDVTTSLSIRKYANEHLQINSSTISGRSPAQAYCIIAILSFHNCRYTIDILMGLYILQWCHLYIYNEM